MINALNHDLKTTRWFKQRRKETRNFTEFRKWKYLDVRIKPFANHGMIKLQEELFGAGLCSPQMPSEEPQE